LPTMCGRGNRAERGNMWCRCLVPVSRGHVPGGPADCPWRWSDSESSRFGRVLGQR
jgi:hypothetical protein